MDTSEQSTTNFQEDTLQKKTNSSLQEPTFRTTGEDEGVTIHVTDSDLQLFPVEECSNIEDCIEKRTVKLSNRAEEMAVCDPLAFN